MNKDLIGSLSRAGGLIVLALGATYARSVGIIDADTVQRLVMGAIGLMVAWYGNRMPKAIVGSDGARQVTRVGGWSMALSGLIYATLWTFAPFDIAVALGCGAIIVGLLITFGYAWSLRQGSRAA